MKPFEKFAPQGALLTGAPIGYRECASIRQAVRIPLDLRLRHCHVIGRPGMGKSRLLEGMVLDDVVRGAGVAVLDPSGDLVQRLLRLVPARDTDRVVYFQPGGREWVRLWNPLALAREHEHGVVCDALVYSFTSLVSGFGDRTEHILRNSFYGALCLPHPTLRDAWSLLSGGTAEGERLRRAVLALACDESAERFWQDDFKRYTNDDLARPRDLLGCLLSSESTGLMLSQLENAFDFRQIMDAGRVLVIDLSALEPLTRRIVGCILPKLLESAVLARSAVLSDKRREFHVYCDDAQCYVPQQLDNVLKEARIFNVSLTLSLQYPRDLQVEHADTLRAAGTTVIFNVDERSARHLAKDLMGVARVEDLCTLVPYEAVARVGHQVVHLRTAAPPAPPRDQCRDEILRHSHECYYRPSDEVRAALRTRRPVWPVAD